MTKREMKNKLGGLIYDQMQLVKYRNKSKTRVDYQFYTNSINEIEELIEKLRKEMGLK